MTPVKHRARAPLSGPRTHLTGHDGDPPPDPVSSLPLSLRERVSRTKGASLPTLVCDLKHLDGDLLGAPLPDEGGQRRALVSGRVIRHGLLGDQEAAVYAVLVAGARYQPVGGDVAVTEFRYQPLGWPGPRRFIAIRRPVPEEPSWQLSLFRLGKFVYQVIVTNLELTPVNLWRFYNDRAEAELVIRELKEAYALGKIPSRRWEVNEAYFQLDQLLLVPAELVRPQGSPMLKLPQSFPHQDAFWETLRQINRLAL